MRLTTIASIVVLAVSIAMLGQVGTAPEEQKLAGNDTAATEQDRPEANTATNEPAPNMRPAVAETDPAVPVGQRPPK